MRYVQLTSFAALIALALSALGCADIAQTTPVPAMTAPSTPLPRVTVDPESQRRGVVGLGEEAVAEVVVRNDGGAPLTLAAPRLRRGTRVEGLVPELAPGESVRVRFRIDTLTADGNRQHSWTLVTNDPDRPRVVLVVEFDVRPFLVGRPGYARYIVVQHAREGTITQTIGATHVRLLRQSGIAAWALHARTPFRLETLFDVMDHYQARATELARMRAAAYLTAQQYREEATEAALLAVFRPLLA
ncbi:MAG: hypothetical protein ACREKS_06545 [Candidatus Rokuibacteriota bacterium]